MEILLVRFTPKQRAFIRKQAKKQKISEAALVRSYVETRITKDRLKKQSSFREYAPEATLLTSRTKDITIHGY